MLLAELNGDAATWVGIGSVAGVVIGALATAFIKISGAWSAAQRVRDRDVVADYQKLLDAAEMARDRYEQARDKVAADLSATLAENLRLKAMVADKDAEIATLKKAGH